jgi:alkylated DNA repair dioxygenase AlkB
MALRCEQLDDKHCVYLGALPGEIVTDEGGFERLWSQHPDVFHEIYMHGRLVKTPRWQQAYGMDYRYTGQVNRALPITAEMQPFLDWSRAQVDVQLNGLLFNWYDATQNHYIGKHRDSRQGLVVGAPIVTISLGSARVFRLRPYRGEGMRDFVVENGSVLVIPWETNLAWTHEVPHRKSDSGRRISVTLRAFSDVVG